MGTKRQWLLLVASTAVTAVVALALIRWLAPGLLGVPADLQLVRVSDELPPFFDGVFREDDLASTEFILKDPHSIQRSRPLFPDHFGMGPNDLLGFRNRAVPNVADVVALGDSQTYGNNAKLEATWPSRLPAHLDRDQATTVYNISCGAWSGPQYIDMARKALHLRPRVLVVAFYSGNDPLGAFIAAYGSDRWPELRLDPTLEASDVPEVEFPPPASDRWRAHFEDGSTTVFTPRLRLASNLPEDAVVQTGWRILAEVGRRVAELAGEEGVPVVFTTIPTKELVYAERMRREGLDAPTAYRDLVAAERRYIDRLGNRLAALPGASYVDLVQPLQRAVAGAPLYPLNADGHPLAPGYDVIAAALAPAVAAHLPALPGELLRVHYANGTIRTALVREGAYRIFSTDWHVAANGWSEAAVPTAVEPRDLVGLQYQGVIEQVDRQAYGPGRPRP